MDFIYFERTDKCYKGFESLLSWKDAWESCDRRVQGSKLVSIHDVETKKFLKTYVVPQFSYFWAGGFRVKDSNNWSWQDGTQWSSSYQDWADGHPNKWNGLRLLLAHRGHWLSKNASETHGFICQY